MKDYEPGVTANPFHVNCRSTTAPYFDENFGQIGERAARDKDGQTYYVPDNMNYQEWKESFVDSGDKSGLQRVDISGNSDIIQVRGDNVALENQRYGRNKNTLVNKTYIDSGEYRRKFDQISDNAEVNKTLYYYAKMALKHRSGTKFEDMYWIDGNTGKVIAKEIDSTVEQHIVYSKATRNAVQTAKINATQLITIHTHPSSMPPSAADFNSCFKNGYKTGYIACHDGKIFEYTSHEEISEQLYNAYISRHIQQGYSEYDAQIMALNKLVENYSINYREVK